MAYRQQQLEDTIVALATPPGIGAIGVVRLSGPEAISLVASVFKGKDLMKAPSHTVHFGRIHLPNGQLLDEVLATLFIAPRSYTGEHVVEISCHGSNFIIQQLIQLFVDQGARLAQPGEFTMRAFLRDKLDLSQAEAVADLIAAGSEAAHSVAMRQMRGGFSQDLQQLRQQLIDFASLIELELDFGEEDVEFANRDELRRLVSSIQGVLAGLIQSFQLGNAIKEGVMTVIAGRPNAGKSTLLNALLNEERAIVSDIAGTTRDLIEEPLNIRGVSFRIIDTAGIREAQDAIEAIGVARTLEKIRQSAVLIYVFDVIRMQPQEVQDDLQRLAQAGMPLLVVANKMDLNPYTKWEHYASATAPTEGMPGVSEHNWIPISARNSMNIEYLKDRLYEEVIAGGLHQASTIVSNARHYEALRQSYQALEAVQAGMQQGITADFVAMDIRRALFHLGEITGEISTEDLLGNIFGRFCIGK